MLTTAVEDGVAGHGCTGSGVVHFAGGLGIQ